MAIPDKLNYIANVKKEFKERLDATGQSTDIPFRQYVNLIENIPNTGAITPDQVDEFTRYAIEISGEKA